MPPTAPFQPWKDTWGILGGAGTPVVASIDARPASLGTFQYVERYLGLTDRLGVDLAGLLDDLSEDATADGGSSGQVAERGAEAIGRAVRDVAERASSTPLTITAVPTGGGPDAAALVEVAVAALDEALADGVPIDIAFIEPAIGAAGWRRRPARPRPGPDRGDRGVSDRPLTAAIPAWAPSPDSRPRFRTVDRQGQAMSAGRRGSSARIRSW